jgi:hypothetical protein
MSLADVEKQGPNAEASLLKLKVKIAKGEVSDPADCRRILEAACRYFLLYLCHDMVWQFDVTYLISYIKKGSSLFLS